MLVLGVLVVGLYAISAEAMDRTFQVGDVFLGVANGQVQWRNALGDLIQTLHTGTNSFTTGMAFDAAGRLYVTNFESNSVSVFDNTGTLLSTFGSGFKCRPESMGFALAANASGGEERCQDEILTFDPEGDLLARLNVHTELMGSAWIDLTLYPDTGHQCVFYTSEDVYVKVFDVTAKRQLPDFNTVPLSDRAFALRLLPIRGPTHGPTVLLLP